MKKKIYFHIGTHKTGTTFLQTAFDSSGDVNLYDRKKIQQLLLSQTPYSFKVEALEAYLIENYNDQKLNISCDEELSGNIHTAGNGRSITYEVIERLSKISEFDVNVIYVIRNQSDMINSCYRQYIKKGGVKNFANYIHPQGHHRHRFPAFDLDHFKYCDVINHLTSRFGSEKTQKLCLFYEEEKGDLLNAIERLTGTGIAYKKSGGIRNISYSNISVQLARRLNSLCSPDPICETSVFKSRALYSLLVKGLSSISKRTKHKKYAFDDCANYYFESNKKTENLLSRQLPEVYF